MRLAKCDKKRCFLPDFCQKPVFFSKSPYIGSDPPYIRNLKKLEKRWWGIRVFKVFFPKIPVYGTSKTTKIVVFRVFWTPPKIIKNRLNFACSKKTWFLTYTVGFTYSPLKSPISTIRWFSHNYQISRKIM